MCTVGNAVCVRTKPESESNALNRGPLIDGIERRLVLVNAKGIWLCEGNSLDNLVRRAYQRDRKKSFAAVECRARVVHSCLNFVRSKELPRGKRIVLLPIETIGPPVLLVEECPLGGVDQQLISATTFRSGVGIVSLIAEL